MRNVNKAGEDLIKQWEGLKLKAYLDTGNVWTIGYGHTTAGGKPAVHEGMTITKEQADEILRRDLDWAEKAVERLVKVPLSDNQFGALVSFTYNLGEAQVAGSTLLKKLNKGQYDAVPGELSKWVYDNGKKVKGLVNRRAAEAGLWVKGDFVSSNYVPATTKMETGETAAVSVTGGASAVAVSIQPIIDIITGQQDALTSGNIAKVAVSVVIIGLTIWYFFKKKEQAS